MLHLARNGILQGITSILQDLNFLQVRSLQDLAHFLQVKDHFTCKMTTSCKILVVCVQVLQENYLQDGDLSCKVVFTGYAGI